MGSRIPAIAPPSTKAMEMMMATMGRSMKKRAIGTVSSRAPGLPAAAGARHVHLLAVADLLQALGDHPLSSLQALAHHHQGAHPGAQLHRPHVHHAVLAHHEGLE